MTICHPIHIYTYMAEHHSHVYTIYRYVYVYTSIITNKAQMLCVQKYICVHQLPGILIFHGELLDMGYLEWNDTKTLTYVHMCIYTVCKHLCPKTSVLSIPCSFSDLSWC